jgi:hypothetical protein
LLEKNVRYEKFCPHCGETKPLDEFPMNRSWKDGKHPYCRPCKRARGTASCSPNRRAAAPSVVAIPKKQIYTYHSGLHRC